MRILHVNERSGFFGGVERILHDTAASLSATGWPQALLHDSDSTDKEFETPFELTSRNTSVAGDFRPDVILVHKYSNLERLESLASAWPAVRMVHDHDLFCLRKHKYRPLHSTPCERAAGAACYTGLCFLQRSAPGKKMPLTVRGLQRQRREMGANSAMRRFIVGSEWMRHQLCINGFRDHDIDIIHPIPRALEKRETQTPPGGKEILYVGQIVRGKGVDLLLRALAMIEHPWTATIVGDGNLLPHCRSLAKRIGIADRVCFTGWVPHEQLELHYARARFSVVPSRWPEPFGMVGPEALARGRPVIAFDSGGIRDWLRDQQTGLLVKPGDVNGMAQAISTLLTDDQMVADMGSAAAIDVSGRLSHQRYLEAMKTTLELST